MKKLTLLILFLPILVWAETLQESIDSFKENSVTMNAVLEGDSSTTVETPEGNFIDSLAKTLATASGQVNHISLTVNSMTALEALDISIDGQTDGSTVRALGYYTKGDGGGGIFRLDTSAAATTPIIRSVFGDATKRWIRVIDSGGQLNVKWWGAKVTDGLDDSTALQAVFDYVAASARSATVYFPSGKYDIDVGLTITSAIKIIGDTSRSSESSRQSTFLCDTNSIDILTITTSDQCIIQDIRFKNEAVTPGDGLVFAGSATHTNMRLRNCMFAGSDTNLRISAASTFVVDACHFLDPATQNVYIDQEDSIDKGDNTFTNCTFNDSTDSKIGIHQIRSGGTRLNNNKFLGHDTSILVDLPSGETSGTSIFIISGGSMEGFNSYGLRLIDSSGGLSDWNSFILTGSQYNSENGATSISVESPVYFGGLIVGNHFQGVGSSNGIINFDNALDWHVEANNFVKGQSCIDIDASSTDISIGAGNRFHLPTSVQIVNASSSSVIDYSMKFGTIAQLRLNDSVPVDGWNAEVSGYTTFDDGAGGPPFVFDAGDTTTADDGGYCIVDAGGNRWKRTFRGPINVKWFGALGQNTSADDQPEIQAAIDYMEANPYTGSVFLPTGIYSIYSTLTLTKGQQSFTGTDQGDSVIKLEYDGPAITHSVQANVVSNMAYRNFEVRLGSPGTRTSTTGILITGTATDNIYTDGTFADLKFAGPFYGIRVNHTTVGAPARFDWNTFTNIKTASQSGNLVDYSIYFDGGTGTGNVYSNCTLRSEMGGIWFDGGGYGQNAGDTLINNIHFGTQDVTGTSIYFGPTNLYKSRISIMNCQFDAGSAKTWELDGCSNVSLIGNNIGGGYVLGDMSGGFGNTNFGSSLKREHRQFLYHDTGAIAASFDVFSTSSHVVGGSYFLRVITTGNVNSRGPTCIIAEYAVSTTTGGTTTVVEISDNDRGPGAPTVSYAAVESSGTVTFTMSHNPLAIDSDYNTFVEILGDCPVVTTL